MSGTLRAKVVKGVFWALTERFSGQAVGFVVSIVLARLLSPSDYGTVALLSIFVAIAGVLADSGFGGALIQKKDANELDFNSVFYLSVVLSGILYLILFFAAPLIASFYEVPELKSILRLTSLCLIFNAINSVQNAELNRKLLFNLSFRISIVSTITSALTGVSLAYCGFGVWALVWASVVSGLVGTIMRWFVIAWRPQLKFSFNALKPLFRYGWKMTCSALLDTGFNNLYGLVIGKMYARSDLAFVNKGRTLPELMMTNVNGTIGRVAFPALASLQDNRCRMRETMRRMMVCSTFVVLPLMAFVALTSRRTILLLYGERWLPAVPYAQLACFMFALWPFHTINLQGIQALGRSDVFLNLEIVKKVLALICLFVFIPRGVFAYMASSAFVLGPLGVIINSWPNRKLLSYSVLMQLADIWPTLALTAIMTVPCFCVGLFFQSETPVMLIVCLTVQAMIALLVYGVISFAVRVRPLKEICQVIGGRIAGKNRLVDWAIAYLGD